MKITAAVVPTRSAPFEIETLDLVAPLSDEVLVRVVASGMCHTDLHARDGYFPNLLYPVVCGHEGAGIIEQVGTAVTDLAPGDPVVISFPWCGECGPCRTGRIAYCERARPLKASGRRADGSIPMSRNGEPFIPVSFINPRSRVSPSPRPKMSSRSAATRPSNCWVPSAVAYRPAPVRCSM